jgi:hypothetical protein
MLNTPLPLGPFMVQEGGRLMLRRDDPKPAFWFIWKGRRVDAWLAAGGVSLSIMIGRTPSTARDSAAREPAFALLRALPGTLPTGWSLRLTPEHTIRLQAFEELAWPATVAELIERLVRFLLSASPYLDVADECGLGMPG